MVNTEMMKMFGDLLSSNSLEKISKTAGTDTNVTSKIVSQALPQILKGLGNNTKTPDGMDGLLSALDKKHTGDIFNSNTGIDTQDGSKILGHILGSDKENLVQNIAGSLNIGGKDTDNVLSSMAPLVLGALGKAKKEGNLDIGSLSGLLSKGDMSSTLITSLLDKDGDGDIKDDLLGMGMNYLKKSFLKK